MTVQSDPRSVTSPSLPPVLYDHYAEAQVIGSCLIRREAYDEVVDIGLSGRCFYKPAHETIFNAIERMAAEGRKVDSITVGEELMRSGDISLVGGVAELHSMVQAVPVSHNADHYAEIVRDRWLMRSLFNATLRMQQMTRMEGEGEVADILARCRQLVDEIVDEQVGLTTSEEDIIDQVIADLSGPKRYTPTPWHDLNVAIGGWRPANLYVIGARPSVGKSVVACCILLDAMRRGIMPILFSKEMRRDQITERLLSNVGSVDGSRILHHSLRVEDEAAMEQAAAELRRYRYVIDDRSGLTVAQIRATVRSHQRRGLPVLPIIDYLQIIKGKDSRQSDRRVIVDEISQDLKNVSRDLGVPVVALAQLNREIEGRAVPEPTMKDLREAGGIEQAADTIALLHRVMHGMPSEVQNLRWIIAKARYGKVSQFSTRFEGEYSRVTDMPRAYP